MSYHCKECGEITGEQKYEKSLQAILERDQLCFSCNFWLEYVAKVDDPASVRVQGIHYWIGESSLDPPRFRGFGGRRFVIHFDDGRNVETSNLWTQGTIPELFRSKLPDNASFPVITDKFSSSKESPGIVKFLEAISGVHRDSMICATCRMAVSENEFRDELSITEFRISRMCQACQDTVFGKDVEEW